MPYAFSSNFSALLKRYVIALLATLLTVACGGGGGSPGTTVGTGSGGGSGGGSGTGTTAAPTLTLALTDTTGASKNSLSPGSPLVVLATVKDATGAAVANTVVTFTLSSPLATISPSSGTALTDSKGVAQVGLEAGTNVGAAQVTAAATVGSTAVTSTTAFSVGAAPSAVPAAINFISTIPQDKAIVIKGAGGNGRTEVALLTFEVVDSSNVAVANKKVDFALQTNQDVTLVNQSAITNQNGQVTATINSGTQPTTVRVIATVDGTTISALSDTLTVSNGQPVQAAFSISVETPNISGWQHDNQTTSVNVLMADQFGNPVADGTPVIFTTDSGAVGSSTNGGCVTANGACSVTFRSQNPRYGVGNTAGKTPGIATITVSSTSGSTTLTGQAYVSLSGDKPSIFDASTGGALSTTQVSTGCGAVSWNVLVADENGNAMPFGTTVSATNLVNVSIGTILPTSVGKTLYPTSHFVTATPDPTKCAAGHGTGTFDLVITPPLAFGTVFSFAVTY